jgi:uncharacterized protein YaeQ
MSTKYSFTMRSEDRRRSLPHKLIVGQRPTETPKHVLLKLFAYVLFHHDRLQLETELHDDNIPFVPDLAQLDYELRPVLWVECGECSVAKLDKLAVKVPEADIWIVKSAPAEAEPLWEAMRKAELRRNRYRLLALDPGMFAEMQTLLTPRNALFWVRGEFDPPSMQFDFNGLWFDAPFTVLEF